MTKLTDSTTGHRVISSLIQKVIEDLMPDTAFTGLNYCLSLFSILKVFQKYINLIKIDALCLQCMDVYSRKSLF
jgi:hypothetical protein